MLMFFTALAVFLYTPFETVPPMSLAVCDYIILFFYITHALKGSQNNIIIFAMSYIHIRRILSEITRIYQIGPLFKY